MLFAAHISELADDQFLTVLAYEYETRTTPGRVLNSKAVQQGQPIIKFCLCLAIVGALELLSAADWDIQVLNPKFRIRLFEIRH